MISDVLTRASGADGIEKYFPERVIEHIRTPSGINYSLANYDDLVDIILENWEHFESVFGGASRGKIKRQLQSLNYKYRRHLAHPHKAEQEGFVFKTADVVEIRGVQAVVQLAMRYVDSREN